MTRDRGLTWRGDAAAAMAAAQRGRGHAAWTAGGWGEAKVCAGEVACMCSRPRRGGSDALCRESCWRSCRSPALATACSAGRGSGVRVVGRKGPYDLSSRYRGRSGRGRPRLPPSRPPHAVTMLAARSAIAARPVVGAARRVHRASARCVARQPDAARLRACARLCRAGVAHLRPPRVAHPRPPRVVAACALTPVLRFSSACSSASTVSVVAREAAWFPGTDAPAHLDGSLAADFGARPPGRGAAPFGRDPKA